MTGGDSTITGDVDDYLDNIEYDDRRVDYARRSGRFVLIKEGKPEIWIYMGTTGDYVIVGKTYCSCLGFASRITREGVGGCTHIAALRRGPEIFHRVDLDNRSVAEIIMECMTVGRSSMLRRIIAGTG